MITSDDSTNYAEMVDKAPLAEGAVECTLECRGTTVVGGAATPPRDQPYSIEVWLSINRRKQRHLSLLSCSGSIKRFLRTVVETITRVAPKLDTLTQSAPVMKSIICRSVKGRGALSVVCHERLQKGLFARTQDQAIKIQQKTHSNKGVS
uniref:Uncharacterized protein n=1 Tax=Cannabis sativa TaxID=3483 RepID=A0A803PKI3_CANSA